MLQNYRTRKIALHFCGLLFLWFTAVSASRSDDPKPAFQFDSTEPYQAVHVPFRLNRGQILVPMELSGKSVECEFDTGTFTSVWSKDLLLTGRRTGHTETMMDVGGTLSTATQEVVLPQVGVGNYNVRDFSTYEMDTANSPQSFLTPLLRNAPLISNDLFCNVVLTIDYYKKELVIRHPSCDLTKEPHAKDAKVMAFTPITHNAKSFYGRPIVEGKINGVPARILLDTGWTDKLVLDEAFIKKTTTKDKLSPFLISAQGLADNSPVVYSDVRVQFIDMNEVPNFFAPRATPLASDLKLTRPALMYPKVKQVWDATVGYDILRCFRITIDYPRKKILLEPYGDDVVKVFDKDGIFPIKRAVGKPVFIQVSKGTTVYQYADGTVEIIP